ncbi:MAG: hypothetical protein D6B26_01200, partial [Spirochaetaceae bacterium]
MVNQYNNEIAVLASEQTAMLFDRVSEAEAQTAAQEADVSQAKADAEETTKQQEARTVAVQNQANSKLVGDPVRVATGGLEFCRSDMTIPLGGLELEIKRFHTTEAKASGFFGRSWVSIFDSRVIRGVNRFAEQELENRQAILFSIDEQLQAILILREETNAKLSAMHEKAEQDYLALENSLNELQAAIGKAPAGAKPVIQSNIARTSNAMNRIAYIMENQLANEQQALEIERRVQALEKAKHTAELGLARALKEAEKSALHKDLNRHVWQEDD